MSHSLKHQIKIAIDECFITGADKHSIKREMQKNKQKNKDIGTTKRDMKKSNKHKNYDHRIYSYADRKNLMDTAMGFVNYLRENYPDIKYVKQIKPKHCFAFLQSKVNTCTQATIVQYSSRLQKLSRVINKHYNIHTKYICEIPKADKSGELRTKVMTREDLKLICDTSNDCTSKRALLLTGETGLRVTSLVRLKVCDVNFEKKTLFVFEDKGKRSRTIPINDAAVDYLKSYCSGKIGHDYIFTPEGSKKHISADTVDEFLRENAVKCGITTYRDAKTGVHAIRKMVALELYYQKRADGMDYKPAVMYVLKYLGHSSYRKDLVRRYLPGIVEG